VGLLNRQLLTDVVVFIDAGRNEEGRELLCMIGILAKLGHLIREEG
jgi:hypothetical protein